MPGIIQLQIILSRTMIGFVIGISAIRMNWVIHGILLCLLIGLPMAVASSMGADMSKFTPQSMFISTLVIGAIYGFLIELVTTVIFKAKQTG